MGLLSRRRDRRILLRNAEAYRRQAAVLADLTGQYGRRIRDLEDRLELAHVISGVAQDKERLLTLALYELILDLRSGAPHDGSLARAIKTLNNINPLILTDPGEEENPADGQSNP